jgi:preprotein translocase subunit SecD
LNRNIMWKIALIVAVLAVFTVAIIPTKNNPEPIKRGLDLKGGTHLVMRVNVNEAMRLEVDQAMNTLRTQAGTKGLPAPVTRRLNDTRVRGHAARGREHGRVRAHRRGLPAVVRSLARVGNELRSRSSRWRSKDLQRDTVDQAVEAIRRRVDALGVTEPNIAPEGKTASSSSFRASTIRPASRTSSRPPRSSSSASSKEPEDRARSRCSTRCRPTSRSEVDILPGSETDDFGRPTTPSSTRSARTSRSADAI